MKRSTWVAVLVTAAVLVVAGNLPRLPLDSLEVSWRAAVERRVAAWPRLARRSPAPLPVPRAAAHAPAAAVPRPALRARIAIAPTSLLATPSAPRRVVPAFAWPAWHATPLPLAAPALVGVLAGLLAIAAFALAVRRDRRGQVWRLARRGLTLSRIARLARVPQDAVRTLLTPGLGARR